MLDNLLGILSNSQGVGIGAFNHMDPVFKERQWMRSATAKATMWAFRRTTRLHRAIFVGVLGDGLLSLTGVDLGWESLTAKTTSLRGNGPDIVVLCLGAQGGVEHFLEVCPLVCHGAVLQLAVVWKMGAKNWPKGNRRDHQ